MIASLCSRIRRRGYALLRIRGQRWVGDRRPRCRGSRSPFPAFLGRLAAAVALLAAPPAAAAETGLTLLEALRLTLEHNFDIAIARSAVGGARGALLGAQGRFDPVITSDLVGGNERTPLAPEVEFLGGSLGVGTELRSGLQLGSAIDLAQADLPGEAAVNDATVSFTIRQPLLRDRGRGVVTAGVRSLREELAATAMSLRSTVEQEVFAAASLYWSWRAASLDLEILRGSERRSQERLATTRRLVAADLAPAADLILLEADLASKRSSRIRGEREEFAARQEMGVAIGLAEAEVRRLPAPSDAFPEVAAEGLFDPRAEERLIALALSARSDLQATRRRLDASRVRVVAAENSMRPRLDLLVVPSYTGRVAGEGAGGLLRPLFEDVHGFSTSVGFVVGWPTANRSARGNLVEAEAAVQQVGLRLDQLERRVSGDVASAVDGLRRNLELLDEARRAVELFAQAVENEEKKLLAGRSTLIDVISQQDRLTASRQVVLSAELSVALSVLELRFQTGSLLAWGEGDGDGAAARLERDRLLSVPAAPGAVAALPAASQETSVR